MRYRCLSTAAMAVTFGAAAGVETYGICTNNPRFPRIPTKQKRRSTGQGAKNPLDPQRPEKKWVPDGAGGRELSRPKRVSWLPASGRLWATSIPVSSVGVKTYVCMNDSIGFSGWEVQVHPDSLLK
jgi:hypothetical protein